MPYGYRTVKGALVPEPAEQAALARMRELQTVGYSTREIARVLADEGHPTKRGGRWTSPVVARILARGEGTAA
ncbi:recombinase family protein [Mycolicibacterium sp. XJ647]